MSCDEGERGAGGLPLLWGALVCVSVTPLPMLYSVGFPKWPASKLKWVELLVPFLRKLLESNYEECVGSGRCPALDATRTH